MSDYFRPLAQTGSARPEGALALAGGWAWCTHVEHLRRGAGPVVWPVADLPADWKTRISAPRSAIARLPTDQPSVMGILNVTPDSFSDGGVHSDPLSHARAMVAQGVHIIDVGGESTRPGAQTVPAEAEIARVTPVIEGLRADMPRMPISIDTRKAAVAEAVGADLINDVSGLTFDPALQGFAARVEAPVCVMHSTGDPETMQNDPHYEDVLFDVYDWLSARIDALEAAGIPRRRIIADPGIGFGKSFDHNLALLGRIALFHGLGVTLLVGVSRKGFIGKIGNAPDALDRMPGSVSVGLFAISQGVQILRVHDVGAHVQAIALWRACMA